METATQSSLFDPTPAEAWDKDVTKRALDELFSVAGKYKTSESFNELIQFVSRFRIYSPYNAMLVQMQKPGARYVAPAYRWAKDFKRRIKPDAHPLVILQPMGPVMFVFEVSDTEPADGAPELPDDILNPFKIIRGKISGELDATVENAKRDGIRILFDDFGSQLAGYICQPRSLYKHCYQTRKLPKPEWVEIDVRYELLLNKNLSCIEKYATLVHELAHLYCGHLGTPNPNWWPDRTGLSHVRCEFEAESVCYLICERLGIHNPSAEYLSGYLGSNKPIPEISLDCVMKAAGLIEQMGHGRMPLRKDKKPTP